MPWNYGSRGFRWVEAALASGIASAKELPELCTSAGGIWGRGDRNGSGSRRNSAVGGIFEGLPLANMRASGGTFEGSCDYWSLRECPSLL